MASDLKKPLEDILQEQGPHAKYFHNFKVRVVQTRVRAAQNRVRAAQNWVRAAQNPVHSPHLLVRTFYMFVQQIILKAA